MKFGDFGARVGGALVLALASTTGTGQADALTELDLTLERLGRVAALYADTALRFTCEERIRGHFGGARRQYQFAYVYGRTPTGKLDDFRFWPEPQQDAAAGGSDAAVKLESLGLPEFISRAYSWIFIFEAKKLYLHQFELAGREWALDRPAMALNFRAVRPYYAELNEWDGTILVDAETFQPLVVRATPIEHRPGKAAYDRIRADPTGTVQGRIEFSSVTTEFGVVQNGMRFPSRVLIERAGGRTRTIRSAIESGLTLYQTGESIYRIEQSYSNYQFFGVRTTEQVRRATLGTAHPP